MAYRDNFIGMLIGDLLKPAMIRKYTYRHVAIDKKAYGKVNVFLWVSQLIGFRHSHALRQCIHSQPFYYYYNLTFQSRGLRNFKFCGRGEVGFTRRNKFYITV